MASEQVYRGKVKLVETLDQEKVKITFTDDITAGDGAKKDNIPGKGKMNLDLTLLLFDTIEQAGVPTHILEREADNAIIARKLEIFPIEVVVRNVVAGSYARRYGLKDGVDLKEPVVEFFVKDDDLHDPLIDGRVAVLQGLVTETQLSLLRTRALQVNSAISTYFSMAGMILVDFKLEFGLGSDGKIYLGDELSADSMRVWDSETREKLDKDRFRKDLGDVLAGYKVILDRLEKTEYQASPVPIIANISITPKDGVTNPAGEVTKRAIVNSGLDIVGSVTMGKLISIVIEDPSGNVWMDQLAKISDELLTNPLIEQYSVSYELR